MDISIFLWDDHPPSRRFKRPKPSNLQRVHLRWAPSPSPTRRRHLRSPQPARNPTRRGGAEWTPGSLGWAGQKTYPIWGFIWGFNCVKYKGHTHIHMYIYIFMNRYMTYIYICVCYAYANHRRLLLSFGIMMINGNICTQRVMMNHVLQLYVYLSIYILCVYVCECTCVWRQ